MAYVDVTDDNFDKEVTEAPELTLVDFWAPWCAPCRQLAPTIEALAEEYRAKLKVTKLNVDDAPSSASRFGIKSIPTVILFKGGNAVEVVVGVQGRDHFAQLIDKHL